MNTVRELPMRVVGRRIKTSEERFADLQRHGLPFWKGRKKGLEVMGVDGEWKPYERPTRRDPAAHG
jgi:hypothetical protein